MGSDFRIFLEGILDLYVCIGSFVLFGGAIFGLQPGLFFVLLLLSAAGYVVCHKMKKAYQRLLEEQAGENRRFSYFIGAAQNEKYGKDMRLYQLSEVVSGKIDGCLKSLVQLQKKYFFCTCAFRNAGGRDRLCTGYCGISVSDSKVRCAGNFGG